jgi:hypothetical protein
VRKWMLQPVRHCQGGSLSQAPVAQRTEHPASIRRVTGPIPVRGARLVHYRRTP